MLRNHWILIISIFSVTFFFVKYFRRPKQKVGHPGVLRMDFPWRRGRISLPIGRSREESGDGQWGERCARDVTENPSGPPESGFCRLATSLAFYRDTKYNFFYRIWIIYEHVMIMTSKRHPGTELLTLKLFIGFLHKVGHTVNSQ